MGTGKGAVSHEFVKPWTPAEATERIKELAASMNYDFWFTDEVKAQLQSLRPIIMSDVTYGLKKGSVREEAELSTQPGVYKYKMVSQTPNSNGRSLVVTVSAAEKSRQLKICSVHIDENF